MRSVPSTPDMKSNPLWKAALKKVEDKKEKEEEKLEVIVEESPSS
jgi:hypothetical protein